MSRIIRAFIISLVIAIGGLFYKDNLNYEIGDVVKRTIIANRKILVDKPPERLRQDSLEIINSSPPVYRRIEFYDSLRILSESLSKFIPNTERFRAKALSVMQRGIIEPKYNGRILIYENGEYVSAFGAGFTSMEEMCERNDTLCMFIFPTIVYDSSLTREYVNSQLRNISKIEFVINPGEVVVSRGEIVNDTTLRILKAYKETSIKPKRIAFAFLSFILGIFIFIGFYLRRWDVPSSASVFVFSCVFLLEIIIHHFTNLSPFFTLSPLIALSVSSLDTPTLGIGLTMVLAVVRGVNYDFGLTLPLYIGSMAIVSSMGVKVFKRRIQNIYIILLMFIAGMISAFVSSPFVEVNYFEFENLKELLVWVSFSSFVSTSAHILFLPNIERIFHKTTEYSLLELASLDHPLLKELSEKAPGTFAHSIAVGHLAETAARVIGADPLLAKVGGYYHDIGKMFNPEYFIENQIGNENPHDKLDPINSARIIISHVKKGIELARKHNLPEEVVNIIASHHGTSLLLGFYLKAKASKLPYSENQFRYPGPKPKTPEEAIVMLADSVEAASRSVITESEIRETVNRVFEDKLKDGQLDWVPLSRGDLERIKEAFIPVLLTYKHTRPKYPSKGGIDEG